MAIAGKMTYEELESRLQETEEILTALRSHEVDAIVGDADVAMVHLKEVEEAVRAAQEELELRVVERTAELARVNKELQDTVEEQERIRRQLEDGQRKYRKLVEELRASESRLLKAQQIARIGNWEVDLANHTVWWSDETYRVLGLEPGQIEPSCEAMTSFTHPEDREAVAHLLNEALEHTRPFSIDHRVVHPSGEERFVHSEAEIDFDVEGKPVRILGIVECITDRKRAQLKLEEYASRLEDQAELLDLAYDMIFVHDMQGKIVLWNRGAERAYGWTREEARGQLSHRLLQTEYSEPLIRITAKIVREGRWEGELVHTTRDGRKIIVASRWALRRGPGGRPLAILEIDNDITDRKHAEQEIVEAKRFAENIVNTMPECLVVLDSQLRAVSANRSFYETFKTTPDQVEGRLFYTLDKGQWDLPELQGKLRDLLSDGAGFGGYELECEVPGEGRIPLMLSAQPINGLTDRPRMILVVIQDVSIQKKHEREIQADKEQLSALTEELLLTEERQRQRIAAALHDSICQSLAFAKRELGALERKAPANLRKSLEEVCGQISQAIDQTRDLTLELAPSVLYTLGLEAAVEDLADQFSDSDGFLCEVHVNGEPRPLSDEMRSLLYRAIRELLVNVSKHAHAKRVSVDIQRQESEIRIAVADDGKGFNPAEIKSAEAGGFGLFSIRQRLAHIGGKLTIESGEGKGTRVTLIAPLSPE
jgi:PAS domain S-box-containing protein